MINLINNNPNISTDTYVVEYYDGKIHNLCFFNTPDEAEMYYNNLNAELNDIEFLELHSINDTYYELKRAKNLFLLMCNIEDYISFHHLIDKNIKVSKESV